MGLSLSRWNGGRSASPTLGLRGRENMADLGRAIPILVDEERGEDSLDL